MANDTINSISEFLLHAGTQYQVFDLGRGVWSIEPQYFLELETAASACPRPRQNKAWFAITFAQAASLAQSERSNDYLWFICLPIDEQSRIVPAARNHFLQLIIEALKADPTLTKGLANNPYVFTPSETQRGQLVSLINRASVKDFAERSRNVIAYLKAPSAMDWRQLITQEIYFAAYEINESEKLTKELIKNWPIIEDKVLHTLLKAWESLELSQDIKQFLLNEYQSNTDKQRALYLLALSSNKVQIEYQGLIASILSDRTDIDMNELSIIAGRYYTQFTPGIIRLFFQACLYLDERDQHNGELFGDFYKDLVAIPSIRQQVISVFNELRATAS